MRAHKFQAEEYLSEYARESPVICFISMQFQSEKLKHASRFNSRDIIK